MRSLASSATSRLWRWIARLARRRRSAILAYHGVQRLSQAEDPELLNIDPDQFEGHIRLLADAGFEFVTVREFMERSSPGLIAISFDDGLLNLRTVALPILERHGIPATVYVPTAFIGQPYPWTTADSGLRIMDAEDIAAMAEAGIEIGAHGVNHRDLSQCTYEESLEEMTGSRDALERITGRDVTTFAYPYFRFSDDAERAARDAGFAVALSNSMLARDDDPFAYPREMVTPQHGAGSLALKVLGRYDWLTQSWPGTLARFVTRPLRRRPKAPLRPRV
jgi:peptidoglycan/xylan/chitin deacetylase (PgdA/CDA1 family)